MPLILIFHPCSPSVFLHPKEMHFKDNKAMKSDKSALWGVFSFYEDWQKNIDGNWLRGKFNFQIPFLVPRQCGYFPWKTSYFFPENLIVLEEKTILMTAEYEPFYVTFPLPKSMKTVFSGYCGLELDLDSIENANTKKTQILVKVSVGTFQNKVFHLPDFWEIKQASSKKKSNSQIFLLRFFQ